MKPPIPETREDIERSLAVLRQALGKLSANAPAAIAFRLAITRNEQKLSQMGGLVGC